MMDETDRDTWTPPTVFTILFVGSLQYIVDGKEAQRIRKWAKSLDDVTPTSNVAEMSIDVETVSGEQMHLTSGAYYGLVSSTAETRKRDRIFSKMLADEKGFDE